MIDITEIVVAVLGLLGLIVTTVLVPWIKSKMTNEQWQMIVQLCLCRCAGGRGYF